MKVQRKLARLGGSRGRLGGRSTVIYRTPLGGAAVARCGVHEQAKNRTVHGPGRVPGKRSNVRSFALQFASRLVRTKHASLPLPYTSLSRDTISIISRILELCVCEPEAQLAYRQTTPHSSPAARAPQWSLDTTPPLGNLSGRQESCCGSAEPLHTVCDVEPLHEGDGAQAVGGHGGLQRARGAHTVTR